MNIPFRAVIFDFDGTLIDSAPDIHAAINQTLKRRGRRPLTIKEATPLIWAGADRMLAHAFNITGEAISKTEEQRALDHFLETYAEHCADETIFYPGALENVAALQDAGIATALSTNKRSSLTHRVLSGFGLNDLFDPIVCRDDVGKRKPAPDPLNEILRRLEISPDDAVMIGDTAADTGAAKAAGVKCVACSFGYSDVPIDQLGADAVIDHHSELLPLLAKF